MGQGMYEGVDWIDTVLTKVVPLKDDTNRGLKSGWIAQDGKPKCKETHVKLQRLLRDKKKYGTISNLN